MASKFCRDQSYCKIGASGILAIISFFLWLVTAVCIATMNKEPRGRDHDDVAVDSHLVLPTVEKNVKKMENPDGTFTVTTTTTTTKADGSKDVVEETTVEHSQPH